jgi:hypothetical protein
MIKFNKPKNLNGVELVAELEAAGIKVDSVPSIDGNNDFYLDIKESDQVIAESIVLAHNGTMVAPEQTIDDKLASVGLSIDDLKVALGL